jgi:glycosyltransferase involved in cell wall biosynthesis
MNWLYVTHPHHTHAKNVALSLYEHDSLGVWLTGSVFSSTNFLLKFPFFGKKLKRRVVEEIPFSKIESHHFRVFTRLMSSRLGFGEKVVDALWEREELSLDAHAAQNLRYFDAVVGFEHGCHGVLKEAKRQKKRSAIIFASPHHSFLEEWVLPELTSNKEWIDSWQKEAFRRAQERDKRRDDEAELADVVFGNSVLTATTLIKSGIQKQKVRTIPLGLYSLVDNPPHHSSNQKLQIMYAGPVSLRKGYPYLHRAIEKLNSDHVELHVYGGFLVEKTAAKKAKGIIFHGNVSKADLIRAYAAADILVFPTLCDGFGQVVGEALSCGLPVICSENAGAVDFIKDGINGFRVRPRDENELKDRLQYCLDNRNQLLRMRDAAFETAKSWNWTNFRAHWFQELNKSS